MDLPYFPQKQPYTCLPACVRMVLAYHGFEHDEEIIASACECTSRGTTIEAAARASVRLGFVTEETTHPDLDWLVGWIAVDQPVIVSLGLLQNGRLSFHAVVMRAFESQTVSYHDPLSGPNRMMLAGEFAGAWGFEVARPW